jgi:SepF-like predicted cell division protein (DUF552 family)
VSDSHRAVMRVISVRKMSEESSNVRVSDGKVGRTERVSDQSDVSDVSDVHDEGDIVINQTNRMSLLKADRSQKLLDRKSRPL